MEKKNNNCANYSCIHQLNYSMKHIHVYVTGKRGNVEINNSPQARIELGASRFKIQHSTK